MNSLLREMDALEASFFVVWKCQNLYMRRQTVQPRLKFVPPALKLWVLGAVVEVLPLWLRYRKGIKYVQGDRVERLVDLYEQFQSGKVRFLIAFRHPSVDDPPCLIDLVTRVVPRVAQQYNVPLRYPTHVHFLYDRGIPLWAGATVGWLFSRLGGTPIQRGKLDRVGLRSARDLFANGSLPMAAAPEGSVSRHSERMNPLEPGVAQLGFWCVEDLRGCGRSEQVVILPVGVEYRYVRAPWKSLSILLSQLEADSGLPVTEKLEPQAGQSREEWLYQRLYRIGDRLLSLMEDFYTRFYHQSKLKGGSLDERLQAVLNAALSVAEYYFGLEPRGNLIERRHRIEQAGQDWIYREDIQNLEVLSPLELGLANRVVEEARLHLWHIRLAESFWAVTEGYVSERPTVERFAETVLLLWELVTRIKGGNLAKLPPLGERWVQFTVGEAISVSERWDSYQTNRRQAVKALTQELQKALFSMMPTTQGEPGQVGLVK